MTRSAPQIVYRTAQVLIVVVIVTVLAATVLAVIAVLSGCRSPDRYELFVDADGKVTIERVVHPSPAERRRIIAEHERLQRGME
jgi:hypothetical protein